MADSKYGRIFTEQDAVAIALYVVGWTRSAESEEAIPSESDIVKWLENFEGHFPSNEPIFVLRGQDRLALGTIRNYETLAQSRRTPIAHRVGVGQAVRAFDNFRVEHPDRIKDPD